MATSVVKAAWQMCGFFDFFQHIIIILSKIKKNTYLSRVFTNFVINGGNIIEIWGNK